MKDVDFRLRELWIYNFDKVNDWFFIRPKETEFFGSQLEFSRTKGKHLNTLNTKYSTILYLSFHIFNILGNCKTSKSYKEFAFRQVFGDKLKLVNLNYDKTPLVFAGQLCGIFEFNKTVAVRVGFNRDGLVKVKNKIFEKLFLKNQVLTANYSFVDVDLIESFSINRKFLDFEIFIPASESKLIIYDSLTDWNSEIELPDCVVCSKHIEKKSYAFESLVISERDNTLSHIVNNFNSSFKKLLIFSRVIFYANRLSQINFFKIKSHFNLYKKIVLIKKVLSFSFIFDEYMNCYYKMVSKAAIPFYEYLKNFSFVYLVLNFKLLQEASFNLKLDSSIKFAFGYFNIYERPHALCFFGNVAKSGANIGLDLEVNYSLKSLIKKNAVFVVNRFGSFLWRKTFYLHEYIEYIRIFMLFYRKTFNLSPVSRIVNFVIDFNKKTVLQKFISYIFLSFYESGRYILGGRRFSWPSLKIFKEKYIQAHYERSGQWFVNDLRKKLRPYKLKMKRIYKFGFADRMPIILRKLEANPALSKKYIIRVKRQYETSNKYRRKLKGSLVPREDIFKILHKLFVKKCLVYLPELTIMAVKELVLNEAEYSFISYADLVEALLSQTPAQLRELVLPKFITLLGDFLEKKKQKEKEKQERIRVLAQAQVLDQNRKKRVRSKKKKKSKESN